MEMSKSMKDALDCEDLEVRNGYPLYNKSKSKCLNYDFCSKLNITTEICEEKGNKVLRCTQGDFAQIQLMDRLLNKKSFPFNLFSRNK